MSIVFNQVSHVYNPKTPLIQVGIQDIDVTIEYGHIYALIGPTGSGKSTFVQHLNGLLLPSTGTINVDEFLITSKKRKNKNMRDLRKKIGVVFQFPEQQLFESEVLKDVMFGPINYKIKKDEARSMAQSALHSVGLDSDYYARSPFDLSGGEKRKVAIAGILALLPDVLVLDEPTAGLDPKNSADILNLINDLHQQGKTVIIITHDMEVALSLADRLIVFHDGRIAHYLEKEELLNSLAKLDFLAHPTILDFALQLQAYKFPIQMGQALDFEYLIDTIKRGTKR